MQRHPLEHARIVDQNVEAAEQLVGGLNRGANGASLARVGAYRLTFHAMLPDGSNNVLSIAGRMEIGDHDISAVRRECLCYGRADAAARSGDQYRLTLELFQACPLSFPTGQPS